MRALLDVNALIALLDPDHSSHERATEWFRAHGAQGWASCPITENGCVRIMSSPGYPNSLPVRAIVERLADACSTPLHEFWPDDISVLDAQLTDAGRIHGPRQVTDIYLLALAVRHGGRFVTFDSSVARSAVIGADHRHLVVL